MFFLFGCHVCFVRCRRCRYGPPNAVELGCQSVGREDVEIFVDMSTRTWLLFVIVDIYKYILCIYLCIFACLTDGHSFVLTVCMLQGNVLLESPVLVGQRKFLGLTPHKLLCILVTFLSKNHPKIQDPGAR